MDFKNGEKQPLSIDHIKWLGFELKDGAWKNPKIKGEIHFVKGKYAYSIDCKVVKRLRTCKDLNKIYLKNTTGSIN